MNKTVDLNADLGESYGPWIMGEDAALMTVITSANVACGGHAGDPDVMATAMQMAIENGVGIGAHPGFADRQGFGRRRLPLKRAEIVNLIRYQVGAAQAGDHMRVGHDTGTDVGVGLDVPDRTKGGVFHVVDTPQTELFSSETQARFFETVFRRAARANRMGVRVNWEDGQGFSAAGQLSLVSDFALPGDIQMTGDGEPAVLLVT